MPIISSSLRTSTTPQPPALCSTPWIPRPKSIPEAEHADPAAIRQKVDALDWVGLDSDLATFTKKYVGQRIDLEHEAIELDEESVLRAMAKYGPSLSHAMAMYRRLMEKGIDCEVEFAVDETDYPTKPAEHIVVVSELQRLGMEFVSFAPRFVGRFEKGVEYIGDIDELQRDFEIHAEIARALGPYKLSLHSGSDKYSTYPLIAEATQGIVHLKTAGTSWAEALRVIANNDPDLMREMLRLALDSFEANRKSYHLSCDPTKIPTDPTDDEVAQLMDVIDSRQVLHVGYGAILEEFRPRLYQVWNDHEEEHYQHHRRPLRQASGAVCALRAVGRHPRACGAGRRFDPSVRNAQDQASSWLVTRNAWFGSRPVSGLWHVLRMMRSRRLVSRSRRAGGVTSRAGEQSGRAVGLLGQVVGQVDRRLDGLVHAEPMLQDQTREIARVDATRQIVASGYGRVRPVCRRRSRRCCRSRPSRWRTPGTGACPRVSRGTTMGHPAGPTGRCRRSGPAPGCRRSRRP